jgi:hypothetical protein
LPIPPPANSDPEARELVRVWAAANAQHVSIATGLWKDPAAWGLALVDLARHVARTYAQTDGRREADVLRRIRVGFDAEWSSPTDTPSGRVGG